MVELNPVLEGLEPDIEGLIVNRMSDPPAYAIAPIDRCYALTGTIKAHWEGLSGGAKVQEAVTAFFDGLHAEAVAHEHATSPGRSGASPTRPSPSSPCSARGPVRYAATPMLTFDVQVSEPTGRQVYMIALTIQVMIEPARRAYDEATRERLVGLFGPPERWSVTTRSLVWAQLDVVVPAFTGSTTVAVPIAVQLRPRGGRGEVPARAARRRGAARDALQRRRLLPQRRGRPADGRCIPWSRSVGFRMPVSVWRETIEHYSPTPAGWPCAPRPWRPSSGGGSTRHATFDATVADLLGESPGG